jgi:hypothetical protein
VTVPRAVPVGTDSVYLKGGGLIRGSLIEAFPNDHATVELADGQTAVIPWERIERIDRGGVTAAPVAPIAPPPSAAPSLAAPSPAGSATVHVESEVPVVVERRQGREWVFACSSPCNAELPLAGLYRIRGTDVRNTSAFHLNARPGETVVLDVNGASRGNFTGGIVLTAVGGGAILIGALVLYVEAVMDWASTAAGGSGPSNDSSVNTVGGVMVAGGAAALVVGVILLSRNMHSKVDQSPDAQRQRQDAWVRGPTWHDDKAANQMPRALGMPLFQLHF